MLLRIEKLYLHLQSLNRRVVFNTFVFYKIFAGVAQLARAADL